MARSRRRIQVRRRQMWARVVSGAMSLLIAFEPAVLQAQSLPVIPVTPQTTLDHAQNGVPLINIATPNGKGVSHNQFEQFNVNPQGLILNNSATAGVSVLGGAIAGNANLQGGTARLILNEVTGASRSALNGATEIFGSRAEYILANPNGITCNGCGFINTPQATLTTGTPVWGADGSLAGLRVNGGDITVSGTGLDAREVDAFDLVARSVFIDAPINGKDVAVVAGRNTYDTKTRQATALADDGSNKPLFAIDSSALGGMYAGRIALIGTEAGVGVRMDGELATSTADLTLSSNRRLEVRKASAAGDVNVTATDAFEVGESLTALGNATVAADAVAIGAGTSLGAVGNVSVAARTIAVDGTIASGMATEAGTVGSGTLTATATETLSVTGTVSSRGDLSLNADALDVSGTATTAAKATLSGRQVALSGQANADHVAISATEDATVSGAADAATLAELNAGRDLKIETTGKVTGQQVALSATRDVANAGTAKASGGLTVTAGNALANASGATLQAGGDLALSANAVSNAGTLQSGNDVKIAALSSFANSDLLFAGKSLTVAAATVANNGGVLLATDDIYIGGANGTAATEIRNAAGVIETANGDIRLVGASVRNVGAQTAEGLTTVQLKNDYYAMSGGVSRPSCTLDSVSCKGEYWKKTAAVPDARPGYTGTSYYGSSKGGSVTSQVYEQQVTGIGGTAAMLTSGRDLFITGETIENRQGTVSATRDIAMTGDTLTNQGLLGTGWWQVVVSNSKMTRCYGDSRCAGFGNGGGTAVLDSWSIELAPAIIQAGRSLTGSFTDRIDNTSIRAGYTQITDTYKALIDQIRAQSVDWGSNAALPQSQAALDAYLGATMPGFNSLYTTATASSTYVYETRADYTNLGTFYGSDYFFSRAGLAPVNYEDLPKRLGDAYFDTQYIRDAIIAETGTRWLNPTVADDSAQLKALIDNAAAVAGDLHLAVGVSLTSDQIAALDRDIVWYETSVVDGQEVLVPRLYLADATRAQITPTGSLIAAADSIDLKAVTVVNAEGKIDAGKTLTVAAAEDIYNVSGKLVSGGDMALTAGGDIYAGTQLATMADGKRNTREVRVGETGITSGGNLKLDAGGDVTISGASVKVGGDATIAADGDVNIQAVAQSRHEEEGNAKEGYRLDSLTHYLSNLEVAGTTTVTAGDDLTVQGANIASGGETKLTAGGDVTVAAVTDTYSLESWKKKKTFGGSSSTKGNTQSATVQRSSVSSGADLAATSGANIEVSASTLSAEGNLSLTAKDSIGLSAQADSFYEEVTQKKSGLQKGKLDATENIVTHQVAELNAGGDLAITAKTGDVALEATKLASTGSTTISAAEGVVGMLSVTDSDNKSVTKSGSNLVWQSMSGKGHNDTTVKMVTIDAGNGLTVTAGNGVVVEYKDGKAPLNETITRLSEEPGLAWLKDMQSRNDVAWNAVAEAHKSWDYKSQGLSGPAAAVIAIAIAVATQQYQLGATLLSASAGTATAAMGNAAVASLITQASLSLINNGGDLGAVFKDLGSSSALTSLASAVVTAGLLNGITTSDTFGGLLSGDSDLLSRIQDAALKQLASATVGTATDVAIKGEKLNDAFKSRMLSAAAGVIGEVAAKEIGDAYADAKKDGVDPTEYLAHKIAHAALGCATGAIASGACGAGAVGGVVGEVVGETYADAVLSEDELARRIEAGMTSKDLDQLEAQGVGLAQLSGALAVALVGMQDVNAGAAAAANAAENNALSKVAIAFAKASAKVLRTAISKGKITIKDDKDSGLDQILDVLDDIATIANPDADTLDKLNAIVDLVVGVNWNDVKAVAKVVEKARGIVGAVKSVSKGLPNYSTPQLQHEFKHASDFGIGGKWSKSNGDAFRSALDAHISDPSTQVISGTYKGQPVVHYYNPNTGNNVFVKPDGSFWGGWKLRPTQANHISTHGGLS